MSRLSASSERVVLRLEPERRNATMAQCASLLMDVVYMRRRMPVMVARAVDLGVRQVRVDGGPAIHVDGARHRLGTLLLTEALPARIAWHLDAQVLFHRFVRRERTWVSERCLRGLAGDIAENAINLGFRPCAGMVHVPLLTRDGLVTTSGYHAPTGLILDLGGLRLTLPERLDRKTARRALKRLLRPFRGYLHRGTVNPVALLTAVLTAIMRPSLAICPGILIDGNVAGVGKGKLARALSALGAPGIPSIITEGYTAEETEKWIAAALIRGAPAILLDNLQREIASSTRESMLTELIADIGAFGKLTNLRVACRSLLLMTANNASLRRDLLRRVVPLRITVAEEKPELRKFDFDPVAEILADRVELLEAAFTILLAWQRVRELPKNRKLRCRLGSFEEWADRVGGTATCLTGKNPIVLIEERRDQDPVIADERRIIEALAAKFGPSEWSAGGAAMEIDRDLWASVLKLKGEQPDAGTIGRWLRARKDRVFGEWMLTNSLDWIGVAKWRLQGMQKIAGDNPSCCARFGRDGKAAKNVKSPKSTATTPSDPLHPASTNPAAVDEVVEIDLLAPPFWPRQPASGSSCESMRMASSRPECRRKTSHSSSSRHFAATKPS